MTAFSTSPTVSRPKRVVLIFSLFALFFLLSVFGTTCHADTTVTATLDKATIVLGETAELTITINGAASLEPETPQMDGLRITRTGQSRQFQFINGSTSSSLTLIYHIEAMRAGKFTIPAVTIGVENGRTIETEAIPLEVLSSQTQPQGSGNPLAGHKNPGSLPDQTAFLQVEVKKQPYVGERVPVTIKAYFPEGLQANVNTLPTMQGDGLVIEQLDGRPRQTSEHLDGKDYNVLIWNTALTGIKEGRYPLQLQLDATLLIAERARSLSPFGRQDPFSDDLFNNFFGGYRKKPIKVISPKIDLGVLPLPTEGQPHDFSGAIGDFSFQVTATPTSIEMGQPFTVTMVIEGDGNFNRVKAPAFPNLSGWKIYPPSAKFVNQGNALQRKKTFEQAVVIKDGNIRDIPSLSFSYFDPQKQEYITRSSQPIPLNVTATGPSSSPSAPAQASSQTEAGKQPHVRHPQESSDGKDLLPIQQQTGAFAPNFYPLFTRPWFLFTVVLCCLIILLILFLFLQRRKYTRNPEHARKRQLRRLAEKAIPEIMQAIEAEDSTLFLRRCRSMIQQQLGILWQLSPETITRTDLTARLNPSSTLLEIMSAAEKSAYAEHSLSVETMRRYAEKLQRECSELV